MAAIFSWIVLLPEWTRARSWPTLVPGGGGIVVGDPEMGDGGRAQRGWYPDYDAPPGHERFWDGAGWTDERRLTAPPGSSRSSARRSTAPLWIGALVVALVLAALGFVATTRSGDAPDTDAAAEQAAASPSPSASSSASSRRTWSVAAVVDASSVELDNGAVVRLVGLTVPSTCAASAASALADMVEGGSVTLTRRGPDRDADGRLLRYVEVGGVDAGLGLIRRGLASASGEQHPRGAIYRRVAARTSPAC